MCEATPCSRKQDESLESIFSSLAKNRPGTQPRQVKPSTTTEQAGTVVQVCLYGILYIFIYQLGLVYIESWYIAIHLYTNWPWYISKVGILVYECMNGVWHMSKVGWYAFVPIGLGIYRTLAYWYMNV